MGGNTSAEQLTAAMEGKRETGDESLSTDAVFDTLSSRRRRYALHYLTQVGTAVSIRDMSEQLAAWENEIERSQVTPKQRKRVYTALHQTHLPKMDRLGIVTFNRDRGRVALTDRAAEFDIYLDVASKNELPWSQFYLGLCGVLAVALGAAALGVSPFAWVDGRGYAVGILGLFTAIAGYHAVRDRKSRLGATRVPPEMCPPPVEVRESDDTNGK